MVSPSRDSRRLLVPLCTSQTGIALLTGGSGKVMDKDPGSEGPDPGNVVYKTRRIRDPDPGNGMYGSGGSEPGSG